MIKENLLYSDYEVHERKKSRIDRSKAIRIIKGLNCPRCKVLLPTLEHSATKSCPDCGLKMTRYGNSLECVA